MDVLAEPSGSDTASHEDAFSDIVATTEELALGEGLAGALEEDIAGGPSGGAKACNRVVLAVVLHVLPRSDLKTSQIWGELWYNAFGALPCGPGFEF